MRETCDIPDSLLASIVGYIKIGKIKPYTGSDLPLVVICPGEKTHKTLCFGSLGE
jgi:hypothetical protein